MVFDTNHFKVKVVRPVRHIWTFTWYLHLFIITENMSARAHTLLQRHTCCLSFVVILQGGRGKKKKNKYLFQLSLYRYDCTSKSTLSRPVSGHPLENFDLINLSEYVEIRGVRKFNDCLFLFVCIHLYSYLNTEAYQAFLTSLCS